MTGAASASRQVAGVSDDAEKLENINAFPTRTEEFGRKAREANYEDTRNGVRDGLLEAMRQLGSDGLDGLQKRGPANALPIEQRLRIDLASCTATLDGVCFNRIDTDALRVLSALLAAQIAGETPISKKQLRKKHLAGCYHDTTLSRWIGDLPGQLRFLIESKSGAGLRLVLPPLNQSNRHCLELC
jgi:hypothetical protein